MACVCVCVCGVSISIHNICVLSQIEIQVDFYKLQRDVSVSFRAP